MSRPVLEPVFLGSRNRVEDDPAHLATKVYRETENIPDSKDSLRVKTASRSIACEIYNEGVRTDGEKNSC